MLKWLLLYPIGPRKQLQVSLDSPGPLPCVEQQWPQGCAILHSADTTLLHWRYILALTLLR